MCGGIHYEEVEGLVSVQKWSFKGVEVDQGRKSALQIIMQLKTVTQVLITKC